MVKPSVSKIERLFPEELVQFATDGASEEADWVVAFLNAAGFGPGEPHAFTTDLLLDLGGMVRLRSWEAAGLTLHRDVGLPTAHEALLHIIDILTAAASNRTELARAGRLGRAVFEFRMSRFAWVGPTEFKADIALDTLDEAVLIEAVAKLLWTSRRQQHTVS